MQNNTFRILEIHVYMYNKFKQYCDNFINNVQRTINERYSSSGGTAASSVINNRFFLIF